MTDFNDPRLQKVYEESKPIVEAHLKKLDKINTDLRKALDVLMYSAVGIFEDDYFLFNNRQLFFLCDDGVQERFKNVLSLSVVDRLKAYDLLPDFMVKALRSVKNEPK